MSGSSCRVLLQLITGQGTQGCLVKNLADRSISVCVSASALFFERDLRAEFVLGSSRADKAGVANGFANSPVLRYDMTEDLRLSSF